MKIIKILVSSLFLFVLLGGNLWAEPRVYHGQGRLLLESGDYLGALDQFNRALEINPQYADALTGLAESYYFLGEYNESLRFFTEAESLKQLSPGEEALMGRALLGMGQPQDAWEVLERVLEREPGNREARFAQAEYFAINLQFNQSARRFGQLLAEQPQDLRALLSLIYLHHSQGTLQGARPYLDRALRSFSHETSVQEVAADHFRRLGDWESAGLAADNLLELTDNSPEALALRGRIHLESGEPELARQFFQEAIVRRNNDAELWYLFGQAQESRTSEDYYRAMRRAIGLAPEEELYRMALEMPLVRETALESGPRQEMAAYHIQRAQNFLRENYLTEAVRAYRRALLIHPDPWPPRLALGQIYRTQGLHQSYLDILEFLHERNPDLMESNRDFRDEIRIERRRFQESLPSLWRMSLNEIRDEFQYLPYRINSFYMPLESQVARFGAAGLYMDYLDTEMSFYPGLDSQGFADSTVSGTVGNGSEAFRLARNSGSDFYVVWSFQEGERDFSLRGTLHISRTGRQVHEIRIYRSGLDRVTTALQQAVRSLDAFFPLRARLVRRNFQRGLINMGRRQGLEEGMEFLVVKNLPQNFSGNGNELVMDRDDVVATLLITRVEDFTAEGTIQRTGFFDLVSPGDPVIFIPLPEESNQGIPVLSRDLFRRLLRLR